MTTQAVTSRTNSGVWPIFVSYRRSDLTTEIAAWLKAELDEQLVESTTGQTFRLDVFVDSRALHNLDFQANLVPHLQHSRALILLIDEGAASRRTDVPIDYLYQELDWWAEARSQSSPIILELDGRSVARLVADPKYSKWCNTTRQPCLWEKWKHKQDAGAKDKEELLVWLRDSIRLYGQTIQREEVRRLKRRERIAWTFAVALLIAAGLAAWQANRAEVQRRAAVHATREANRQLAEANWLVADGATSPSFGSSDQSPIKATHYLLRSAAASESADEPIASQNASLAALFSSDDLLFTVVHNGPVTGAQTSPDGKRILTWSEDGKARLWKAEDGTPTTTSMEHSNAIQGAQFSGDGQWILTWGWDKAMRVWRSRDARLFQSVTNDYSIQGAMFSTNAERFLCWSDGGTASVWKRDAGTNLGTRVYHGYELLGAEFSFDSHRIVTWGKNGKALLWNTANGKPIGLPMQHQNGVEGVVFSPDGKYIVTWGNDAAVRLWNAFDGAPVRQLFQFAPPTAGREQTVGASFSSNGELVLIWSSMGSARIFQTGDGIPVGNAMSHGGGISGATFSPDNQRILTWSLDGSARLWEATNSNPVGQRIRHQRKVAGVQELAGVQFSADSKRILTWSRDGTSRQWDGRYGDEFSHTMSHESGIKGTQFIADDYRILTWSSDGTTRLWKANEGKVLGESVRNSDSKGVSLSSDDNYILTWRQDGTSRLWDTERMSEMPPSIQHPDGLTGATFSEDAQIIATWSRDGVLKLWRVVGGREIGHLNHGAGLSGAAFSSNGLYLATWDISSIRLWDVLDGASIGQPIRHDCAEIGPIISNDRQKFLTWNQKGDFHLSLFAGGVTVVRSMTHAGFEQNLTQGGEELPAGRACFSPDDQLIATWGADGNARVWTVTNQMAGSKTLAHGRGIQGAAFSNDGQLVATWSVDGITKIWELHSGRAVGEQLRHLDFVRGARFSENARMLLTWSLDGAARLWNATNALPIGQPMKHSNYVADAGFTKEGRKVFTWSSDGTARLWDSRTTHCIGVFKNQGLVSARLSRNEKQIITVNFDATATFWDISLNGNLSVRERTLQFELRSASAIGLDGQVRILSEGELAAKRNKLDAFKLK